MVYYSGNSIDRQLLINTAMILFTYASGCNVVLVLHTPVTVLSLYVGTAWTVTIGVTLQADRTLRVAVTG